MNKVKCHKKNNEFAEIRNMDESKRLDAFMKLDANKRFEHLLNTNHEDLCFLNDIERKSIIDAKNHINNMFYKDTIKFIILSLLICIVMYIIKL